MIPVGHCLFLTSNQPLKRAGGSRSVSGCGCGDHQASLERMDARIRRHRGRASAEAVGGAGFGSIAVPLGHVRNRRNGCGRHRRWVRDRPADMVRHHRPLQRLLPALERGQIGRSKACLPPSGPRQAEAAAASDRNTRRPAVVDVDVKVVCSAQIVLQVERAMR